AGAAAPPARRRPGAARHRARSAPRHRRGRAPAGGAGRCAAPASRSSVRAPSRGGRGRPAPWRPRARARRPDGRRPARTGTPGTASASPPEDASGLGGGLLAALLGRLGAVLLDERLDLVAALVVVMLERRRL